MLFKKNLLVVSMTVLLCAALIYVFVFQETLSAGNLPSGSYQKTCRMMSYNESNDLLGGQCKDMNGNWKTTTMTGVKNCQYVNGDISNCNGELKCTGAGLPGGSYKKSCWCCYVTMTSGSKYRLTCYCNPKKGKANLTSLEDAFGCYYANKDIANINGTLKCQ